MRRHGPVITHCTDRKTFLGIGLGLKRAGLGRGTAGLGLHLVTAG